MVKRFHGPMSVVGCPLTVAWMARAHDFATDDGPRTTDNSHFLHDDPVAFDLDDLDAGAGGDVTRPR